MTHLSQRCDHDESLNQRTEEFLTLFTRRHRELMIYLTSLLPSSEVVDDVFQETSAVLWREFDNFQPGTNFDAWAYTIAFNQVRAWRKKQNRDQLAFSNEFVEAVSEEMISESTHYERRLSAVQSCIRKLPTHHREMVRLRYSMGTSVEDLSLALGRTVDATYRMLSRIRHTIGQCITMSLANGDEK